MALLNVQRLFHTQGFQRAEKYLTDTLKIKLEIQICSRSWNNYTILNATSSSPKNDPIVRECQGLVLSLDNNYQVARMGFEYVYDYSESDIPVIDFSREVCCEQKLDGHIIYLTYVKGVGWIAGTRTEFFSREKIIEDMTWAEMFWRWFDGVNMLKPGSDFDFESVPKDVSEKCSELDINYIYVFELTGLGSRITDPGLAGLYLIGMRRAQVLNDRNIICPHGVLVEVGSNSLDDWAGRLGVKRPDKIVVESIDQVLDIVRRKDQIVKYSPNPASVIVEGWVLKQKSNTRGMKGYAQDHDSIVRVPEREVRVKCVSGLFRSLDMIKNKRSLNELVRTVLNNEIWLLDNMFVRSDVSLIIRNYNIIDKALVMYCQEADRFLEEHLSLLGGNETSYVRRKRFAEVISQSPFANYCWARANGRVLSGREYMCKNVSWSKIRYLIGYLNLKDVVDPDWRVY